MHYGQEFIQQEKRIKENQFGNEKRPIENLRLNCRFVWTTGEGGKKIIFAFGDWWYSRTLNMT